MTEDVKQTYLYLLSKSHFNDTIKTRVEYCDEDMRTHRNIAYEYFEDWYLFMSKYIRRKPFSGRPV